MERGTEDHEVSKIVFYVVITPVVVMEPAPHRVDLDLKGLHEHTHSITIITT